MAKRKTTRGRKPKNTAPQHTLPAGFWSQVLAGAMILVSILLIVAWFGAGGPVLEWLHRSAIAIIGYAVYFLPFLLCYVAVEIFRAERNRLPFIMKFASTLLIIWLSGIFGLMKNAEGLHTGGLVGDLANKAMLGLVDSGIAVVLYAFLILVTVLFVLRISLIVVIQKIWESVKTSSSNEENEKNVKVMRAAKNPEALESEKSGKKKIGEIKLNQGVPILDPIDTLDEKKPSKLSTLVGVSKSEKSDKEEPAALVMASDPNWKPPSLELLEKKQAPANAGDVQHNAQLIKDTLGEFNIDVEMEGANIGPKVTQYTLKPPSGVKLTRISALETNIALNLAAQSLRIEAPIPGQRAVGIEVPNLRAADVRLYGILNSKQWKTVDDPLGFAVGKNISGDAVVAKLAKAPHLLIAGQTGSGKSVMINTLLTSLLYRNSPSDMKLILVDPKQVEMAPYADIPHLLTPIITDPEKTISALKWAVNEMERRYTLLSKEKLRDIKSYNQRIRQDGKKIQVADEDGHMQNVEEGAMPYVVIVIDELADLMMVASRDVETLIVRLAQKARAVGIHLVLATQRPSVNVITGLIKANVPSRIAFTVASGVDSRTILDQYGAEKLLGQGDMLMMMNGEIKPTRIQGAWVTDDEVIKITDHLRMQAPPQYNDEIISQPVQINNRGGIVMSEGDDNPAGDDIYMDAVRSVIEAKKASASLLQRKLRIGYGRAARLIETMEEQGIVSPADGSRPRDVLISSVDDLAPSE